MNNWKAIALVLAPAIFFVGPASAASLYAVDTVTAQLLIIDENTAEASIIGSLGSGYDNITGLSFDASNTLWGYDRSGDELVTIDTATGAATTVATLTSLSLLSALAFDSSGTLYAVQSVLGLSTEDNLVTINTTTGAVTTIGLIAGSNNLQGLAFDSSDALFASDIVADVLISVNTGDPTASTTIGGLGVSGADALTFDPSGILYGVNTSSPDKLLSLNPTTGSATEIGTILFAGTQNIVGGVSGIAYGGAGGNDGPGGPDGVVPVPANLPLLLGGLSALAFLRRRKA